MRNKINQLLDKPWTTRGYLKCTGVCVIIYAIIWGICVFVDNCWEPIMAKFSKKSDKESDEI